MLEELEGIKKEADKYIDDECIYFALLDLDYNEKVMDDIRFWQERIEELWSGGKIDETKYLWLMDISWDLTLLSRACTYNDYGSRLDKMPFKERDFRKKLKIFTEVLEKDNITKEDYNNYRPWEE